MKIAIVCGSPSSEFLAPFDDPEWKIWVLGNRLDRHLNHRIDKVFEIHDDLSEHGDIKRYTEWLVSHNIPMIVGEKFPIKKDNIVTFPFEQAKKLYGSTYLTSSTAYMIALAILEGAKHIGIYGVDMAVDSHEYFWQRACVEAWIGFAKGLGIEVTIPPVSPVGRCDYVEGMGCGGKPDFSLPPFTQKEFQKLADEHASKMAAFELQVKQIEIMIAAHNGAKQVYERLAKVARAVESGQDIQTIFSSFVMK